MELDRASIVEIARLVDKDGHLGLVEAAQQADQGEHAKERGPILDVLSTASQASTIILAIRLLVVEVNALLKEIEADTKDPIEILRKLEDALRTRYLEPLNQNKARIQSIINAILQYVKSKLGK